MRKPFCKVWLSVWCVVCGGGFFLSSPVMAVPVAPQMRQLQIPLFHGEIVNRQNVSYQCEPREQKALSAAQQHLMTRLPRKKVFTVSYINADMTSLAVLPIEGKTLVFANVVSGSGAKYVADRYLWWTKGDEASFAEESDNGGRLTCHIVHEGRRKGS